MTPDLLRAIGEAAYGERWQTPLAEAVGVRDRMVRYWLSGRPMPPDLSRRLGMVLTARMAEISAAKDLLAS